MSVLSGHLAEISAVYARNAMCMTLAQRIHSTVVGYWQLAIHSFSCSFAHVPCIALFAAINNYLLILFVSLSCARYPKKISNRSW